MGQIGQIVRLSELSRAYGTATDGPQHSRAFFRSAGMSSESLHRVGDRLEGCVHSHGSTFHSFVNISGRNRSACFLHVMLTQKLSGGIHILPVFFEGFLAHGWDGKGTLLSQSPKPLPSPL